MYSGLRFLRQNTKADGYEPVIAQITENRRIKKACSLAHGRTGTQRFRLDFTSFVSLELSLAAYRWLDLCVSNL